MHYEYPFLYKDFIPAILNFSGNIWKKCYKYALRVNLAHCFTTYSGISSYPAENLPFKFFITHYT